MRPLPRDVEWLANRLLPPETAEVILGDLHEESGDRFGSGRTLGRALWLRVELLRSLTAFARETVRRTWTTGGGRDPDGSGETMTTTNGTGFMTGLRATAQDLRFAFRTLIRNPTFTFFAVAILALGVGSATAVYAAVERVILSPLPYPDADRMVVLWRTTDGATVFIPEPKHVRAWSELDVFETIRVYRGGQATLTGRGEPAVLRVKAAGPGYFDFLGARPILGRGFSPEEHRGEGARVTVLSHEFWTGRLGAREDVLGRTLTLDDEPWTVVGVLPPRVYPPNSGPGLTDLWTPLGDAGEEGGVWPVTRLRPGVTVEQANERLAVLAEGAPAAGLGPAAEWRGKAFEASAFGRTGVAEVLKTLFAAVILFLLVAAVNVSNLALQRAATRDRETAVRAALGAGRLRLLRQLLLEGLLLSAAGGILGLALARGALAIITATRPEQIGWLLDGVRIQPRVLVFSLLVSTAAGLVAGLLPAIRLLRGGRGAALLPGRHHGGGDTGRSRTSWALVSSEVGLSFALLTTTVMVLGTLAELRGRDPGFQTEGLVRVDVALPRWRYEEEAGRRAAFEALVDDLRRRPGVSEAVVTAGLPPGLPGRIARLHPEGDEPLDQTSYVRSVEVDPGFLGVLGQPLVAGRDLTPADQETGSGPAVIGRSLAQRLFPGLAPAEVVGRHFSLDAAGEPLTIVGVAEDIRVNGLADEPGTPLLYRPRESWPLRAMVAVRLEPGTDPARWTRTADLRSGVSVFAPEAVVEVRSVRADLSDSLVQERFTALLVTWFGGLALLLAGVGLYGVLSRAVTGRTRELGIRMSLGADARAVRGLVFRAGAGATLAGLAGGALLAWLGLRTLSTGLLGLDAGQPRAYVVAAVLVTVVATVAVWAPARRATRLDPSLAMRSE